MRNYFVSAGSCCLACCCFIFARSRSLGAMQRYQTVKLCINLQFYMLLISQWLVHDISCCRHPSLSSWANHWHLTGHTFNVGQVQHGKEGLYAARDVHSCLLYLTSADFGLFKLHDALCNVAHFPVVQLTFAPVVHVRGLCSFVESHR